MNGVAGQVGYLPKGQRNRISPSPYTDRLSRDRFAVVAPSDLAPRLVVDVVDAGFGLVDKLAITLHPVLRPLDVLLPRQSGIEGMLPPEVPLNGGVGVVGKEQRRPKDFTLRAEGPSEVPDLAVLGGVHSELAPVDHRDALLAKRRHQLLQPEVVDRLGVGRYDHDEPPDGGLDADVQRVAESEVLAADAQHPGVVLLRYLGGAVVGAGVDVDDLKIPVPLPPNSL